MPPVCWCRCRYLHAACSVVAVSALPFVCGLSLVLHPRQEKMLAEEDAARAREEEAEGEEEKRQTVPGEKTGEENGGESGDGASSRRRKALTSDSDASANGAESTQPVAHSLEAERPKSRSGLLDNDGNFISRSERAIVQQTRREEEAESGQLAHPLPTAGGGIQQFEDAGDGAVNIRLFCFPWEGGSSTIFETMSNLINNVQLIAIEYPGSMARRNDVGVSDLRAIAGVRLTCLSLRRC